MFRRFLFPKKKAAERKKAARLANKEIHSLLAKICKLSRQGGIKHYKFFNARFTGISSYLLRNCGQNKQLIKKIPGKLGFCYI